jgi:hypothetical protein
LIKILRIIKSKQPFTEKVSVWRIRVYKITGKLYEGKKFQTTAFILP